MKIYFKSLTPIHIGNGEELNTLDYIIHDRTYYRFSQDHFLQFISAYPGMVERYTEWIDKIVLKIEDLERKKVQTPDQYQKRDYNQQLADIRAKMNVVEFAREVQIIDKLLSFVNNSDKVLRIPIQVQPKPQIRGLVAAPGNRYYIPGTTLKGATRTALLYAFLESEPNPDKISKILQRSLDRCQTEREKSLAEGKKFRPDKFMKTFADELEHFAFYCSFINEKGKQIDHDEKYDIFKFLSISDCPLVNPGLTLANIDLYLLSRQRSPRGDGFELKAVKQKQAPCVEAIESLQLFEAEIDVNLTIY
jgi:CRISPR-associated protein Csm5